MSNEKMKLELQNLIDKYASLKKSWGEERDSYLKEVDAFIEPFKNRVGVNEKQFVHVVDIKHTVVPRRLCQYCAYTGNHYIGKIYVDKNGNVFESVAAVRNAYGDDAVLCPEKNNSTYYLEAAYVPEIECVLIGVQSSYWSINVMSINDDNEHLNNLHGNNTPNYFLIRKDTMVLGNQKTPSLLKDAYVRGDINVVGLIDATKQLFDLNVGVVNVGGNKYVPLNTLGNLYSYVSYKAKLAYKSGKIQKKIDELIAKKDFDSTPLPNRMPHEYHNLVCKTYINKIEDNLCVIRWNYSYQDECFDGMRVYIDGTDVYACKRNNQGQFVKVALSTLNQKNFTAEYNSEIEIDDMTGTRLEWYSSVINRLPEKYRMTLLMLFLTDVKIEQLVKLGFGHAICKKMDETTNNIGTTLRNMVGVNEEAESGKNIYRWIGLNKHQLDACVNLSIKNNPAHDSSNLIDVICDIKTMFDGKDISSYNDELFDNMLNAYDHMINTIAGYWAIIPPINIGNLLHKAMEEDETGVMKSNMLKNMPRILEMCEWHNTKFGYFIDYIGMVNRMGIRKEVRLYPTSMDDLIVMHDMTSAAYNVQRDRYRHSEFVKRIPDWEKFEYENDDFDFSVVTPKKPEDLAVEGIMLHHCVKSYIDRVTNGHTNILFIRKKGEPNVQFFTVELTNNRVISQVHGFANRNADTEPGMIEFIDRWAKNKRLKIGAFDSVRG